LIARCAAFSIVIDHQLNIFDVDIYFS